VMKTLMQAGLIHCDCLTVTGKTVEENLKDVKGVSEMEKQDILFYVKNPLSPPLTHITIIKGNIAPNTAVLKLGGKQIQPFIGPAVVFDDETSAYTAVMEGKVKKGGFLLLIFFF